MIIKSFVLISNSFFGYNMIEVNLEEGLYKLSVPEAVVYWEDQVTDNGGLGPSGVSVMFRDKSGKSDTCADKWFNSSELSSTFLEMRVKALGPFESKWLLIEKILPPKFCGRELGEWHEFKIRFSLDERHSWRTEWLPLSHRLKK
jgi:hypothetical protein